MARNRKRAKERRARRQPAPSGGRSRAAAAGFEEGTPDPIEHATPDVELAEAQLAAGRPAPEERPESDQELEAEEEREAMLDTAGDLGAEAKLEAEDELEAEDAAEAEYAAEVVPARAAVPEARAHPRGRLIGFLQGSWRELQRVQWPDRRQVVQATGVVIGFVIVAGLYLAAADGLASKLMDYILK